MNQNDLAGAVAILEHLTDDDPTHDRSAARRSIAEAARAWPGDPDRLWSKWFTEASRGLGLRTKSVDCSVDEAWSLIDEHIPIVCYRHEAGEPYGRWLAVLEKAGRRHEVLQPEVSELPTLNGQRALKKTLRRFASEGRLRCVIVQPGDAGMPVTSAHGGTQRPTPFERLGQLMKPEAPDLWLVVIFAFTVSLLMLATPIAVEALVNTVAFGRFLQPIVVLAVILLTFLGFQGAIRALQTYVVEIVQRRLFARIAGDLAYRLPRTEAEESDETYMPEMVNRFFDVVTVQKVAAQLLLDGLGLILSTLVGMAVLAFYHPWLLGFDLFLLTAIAVIIFVLGRGAVASAVTESKHKYRMAAWLEDIARCQTAFRTSGGEGLALERADRLIHEYLDARRDHFRILMRQILFALGLQAVASTVLLGLGGWLVVSGELTLGQLVAAELIVTVIVGSFAKFGKHMESLYDLLASVDKLGSLFDLRTERQDGILAIDHSEPVDVDLHAVCYSRPGRAPVIDGVTAKVNSGDRMAILGGAGSGKSLLLDMIYGLREPTAGHLLIDGYDPRSLRPDILRSRIALARGTEVFHATVAENVHLHRADVTSTDVRDALESIGLLEPVLKMQGGCDAMLTSDGAPLSESHRRMLGIARASVGRPGLLLVDGCLDSMTEEELNRCLDYLLAPDRPWTLIVATSREDIAGRIGRTIPLEFAPAV